MASNPQDKMPEPKMDRAALYREEIYTDRRVGTIRRMIPVTADGAPDNARKTLFVGEAQLLTAAGAVPLNFEIDAASLDQAVTKFGEAAKRAVERTMQELQELRRQASSSILIPEAGAGGAAGLPPGMLPGGGKIKLP